MVKECGGNPGMSQLQQRSPSGTKKDCRLPAHLPRDGIWTEKAETGVAGKPFKFREPIFYICAIDVLRSVAFGHHLYLDAERVTPVSLVISRQPEFLYTDIAPLRAHRAETDGIAINSAIVSTPSQRFCNRRFSFAAC